MRARLEVRQQTGIRARDRWWPGLGAKGRDEWMWKDSGYGWR